MKDFDKALKYSFLLLRYRPRSRHELYQRLRKKKFSLPAAQEAIKYLKGRNYINDSEFVNNYIHFSLEKGWGPVRAEFNLERLGVCAKLRQEAVKEIEKKSKPLVKKQLEEKLFLLKKNDPGLGKKKAREKALRYMVNKGHRYADIAGLLNKECR